MSGDAETLAEEFARSGFFCWLLTSGDSALWAERTPEQEMARVVLASDWLAAHDAAVRAAALEEALREIARSVPLNYELRHDGTEDPLAAAYVEGVHDAPVELRRRLYAACVKAAAPDDPTGHLPNCGYTDESQTCGCADYGKRLWDAITECVIPPGSSRGADA